MDDKHDAEPMRSQAWQVADRVDPCLRAAVALGWADHSGPVGMVFELMPGLAVKSLVAALGQDDRVRTHWQGEQAVFGTAWLTRASAARWCEQGPPACIARFEVGMFWRDWRDSEGTTPTTPAVVPPRRQGARSSADTLLVVMDHGCPFAHPDLRRPDGQTAILRLWDQDDAHALGAMARCPQPWGYGADLDRTELMALLAQAGQDEAVCYARMGYHALQRRAVHGAHVLGQMMSPAAHDVVFVQLPRSQLQTLSRGALLPFVLDGAMYALSLAAPGSRVVVNLSLEAYDGPHDADSLWASALQALVWHARQAHQVTWTWVMAAGNAALLKVHARMHLEAQVPQTLVWRLPPVSEHVAWLELWWPEHMGDLTLWLQAPGDAVSWRVPCGALSVWPSPSHPMCLVAYPRAVTSSGRSMRVRLAPTASGWSHPVTATAGDWTLRLSGSGTGTVRACLARVWQGLGGHPRGRQGELWTGQEVSLSSHDLLRPDDGPRPDSISGLVCDIDGVRVAQAMRWRNGQLEETAYSGRGQVRAVSAHCCEESGLLHGVRGWGALGGQTVRMNGTSVAVPQAVRTLTSAGGRAPP